MKTNLSTSGLVMRASALFALLVYCHAGSQAQTKTLLALSKANHTLSLVDPVSLKVIAKLPVGQDPHEVVASSDGKMAYVSNTGGGHAHEINALDLVAQKALPNIDTGPFTGPHGLMFMGGKVWFSAEGAKSAARYDPATNKVDWCMGTGQDRTHMIYVSTNEREVYTTNVSSGTVSILTDTLLQPSGFAPPGARPRRDWIQIVIPVSVGAEGFDVTPDGKELWTAASGDGVISIIDLATKKLSSQIDAKVKGANRLKFSPNGKLAFISSLGLGDLFVYDVATRKEIKRIPVGRGASGLLVDLDGSRLFAACSPDGYVAIIDLKTLEVTGHLDVGGNPDGLAWAIRK